MTPKKFAEMWVNREFTSEDNEINVEVLANLIEEHFVSRDAYDRLEAKAIRLMNEAQKLAKRSMSFANKLGLTKRVIGEGDNDTQ